MKSVIEAIHPTALRFFVAVTGGGSRFIADFLEIPGASKNLLGAYIPYSKVLFDRFAGAPDHYSSMEAARKLAVASWLKSKAAATDGRTVGLGGAFSLAAGAEERPGRRHRFHLCVHSLESTLCRAIEVSQGATRQEEEALAGRLLLSILAARAGISLDTDIPYVLSDQKSRAEGGRWQSLMEEAPAGILFNHRPAGKEVVIYPGSFNPRHYAHEKIAAIAQEITGIEVLYEIAVRNVDKPPLDYLSLEERLEANRDVPLLVSNTPRFIDKLKLAKTLFPAARATFVVGADTWNRIFDPKYYTAPETALEELRTARFLVFPRPGYRIEHLDEPSLILHPRAQELAITISSSALRRRESR